MSERTYSEELPEDASEDEIVASQARNDKKMNDDIDDDLDGLLGGFGDQLK